MSLGPALLRDLERDAASVKPGERIGRYTTFGIGGPADAFVTVETSAQLRAAVSACQRSQTPFFVLGSGSNIVVGDDGIRGVTIENNAQHLTEPAPLDGERFVVRADAGCSFAATARKLSFAGYAGLEWASGIPGTIGGAVVYNAGAYGGCLADVLLRIGVLTDGKEQEIEAAELGLVYRGSAFTRGVMAGRVVLWAEFALWRGDPEALRARVLDFDARRLKAQPRGRNAGSTFKNPPERPAWRLIEDVGLRGHRIGDAEFSEKHCNFIVNRGQAKAADVAGLIRLAQGRVRERHGLDLQLEVALVGEGF
jgi:UDP-N-acetylmuramate dehydrogenase